MHTFYSDISLAYTEALCIDRSFFVTWILELAPWHHLVFKCIYMGFWMWKAITRVYKNAKTKRVIDMNMVILLLMLVIVLVSFFLTKKTLIVHYHNNTQLCTLCGQQSPISCNKGAWKFRFHIAHKLKWTLTAPLYKVCVCVWNV